LSSEYTSESKTSTGSTLLLYTSSLSLLLPPSLSLSPIDSPLLYHYNMNQSDYPAIIRQLQEQITTLSEQVAVREGEGAAGLEVAKPQVFDRTLSKISEFVTACKLYGKAKMKGVSVEEQIQ